MTELAISPAPQDARIFISYARKDGEDFARAMRKRLSEEYQFALWQDRKDMEGGKDWWQQIETAIKSVEYMILVMTPAALDSKVVRQEWRRARQEGVCVLPVLTPLGLDFDKMPRWMRDAHFMNTAIQEQW